MRLEILKSSPSITGWFNNIYSFNQQGKPYIKVSGLLVKWGRWFLQIVDIHVGNFNMKLTGRWFPQIVDRDSGNLYPIYI